MALLEIEKLGGHYGRVPVLRNINLTIETGELVVLVGSNGAGKTTLMRTISGIRPASSGRIRFAGRDITNLSPAQRVKLGIAQVPEGRQVFPALSVEANLELGGFTRTPREVREGVARAYAMFPILKAKRRELAGMLSGGQQQMLAIARALMSQPKLLLLDEPTMGLAPNLVPEVCRTVRSLKDIGATIFLVEQNARAALRIADRGFVMETGELVEHGVAGDLLANDRVRQAYLGV
ncbi:MAG: ABC transporter ATP-binding protein [Terriglobales bacterium]